MMDFIELSFRDLNSKLEKFEKINSIIESAGSCKYNKIKPVKVIFNKTATIVWFSDGDKIVSKHDGKGEFCRMTGFLTCYYKKFGNESIIDLWDRFEKEDKIIL